MAGGLHKCMRQPLPCLLTDTHAQKQRVGKPWRMHVEMARRNARSNVSVRAGSQRQAGGERFSAGSRPFRTAGSRVATATDIGLRRRPVLIRRAISLSANAIYFGLLLPIMDVLLMTSRRG